MLSVACLRGPPDRVSRHVLQALFDLQLSSIKHYNIGTFSPDVKVHYIVHRYAQLTASLLCLNADYQVWTQSSAGKRHD